MKKPVFITILLVVCLALAGTLGYLGYTAYNFSQTLKQYENMEYQKTLTVDAGDTFINPLQRITDVSMIKDNYSEYKYVYEKDNIHFLSNDLLKNNIAVKLILLFRYIF